MSKVYSWQHTYDIQKYRDELVDKKLSLLAKAIRMRQVQGPGEKQLELGL